MGDRGRGLKGVLGKGGGRTCKEGSGDSCGGM